MKKVFLLLTGLCFFLCSATTAMDEYISLPYISFDDDAVYYMPSDGGFVDATFSYSGSAMTAGECKSKLNTFLQNKGHDVFITISYVSGNEIGIDITPNPTSEPRSFDIGAGRGTIRIYQE